MKAMIFAAGLGTRLAPLTDICPKALIEVGGRPMLERAIKRVVSAGATEVVVNVHHHSRMIIDYLASRDFGVPVVVSDETESLLDTGGGVVKASKFFEGTDEVILCNADIFTDLDLSEMLAAHRRSGRDVTLLTSSSRPSSRLLLFDPETGLMKGWRNTVTGVTRSPFPADIVSECQGKAFGGIHVITPRVINLMKEWGTEPCFSITPFYIANCDRLAISSYEPAHEYVWVDIGRPETLALARSIASDGLPTDKKS